MNRFISSALCYGKLDKQRAKGFNKPLLKIQQKARVNPILLDNRLLFVPGNRKKAMHLTGDNPSGSDNLAQGVNEGFYRSSYNIGGS